MISAMLTVNPEVVRRSQSVPGIKTWFMDDSYHFAIQAGWEEQVWLNWGLFGQPLGQSSHDLSLHGLNLKLRFDF